jgi:hypothetical protein
VLLSASQLRHHGDACLHTQAKRTPPGSTRRSTLVRCQRVVTRRALSCARQEVRSIFRIYDTDGSGGLDVSELIAVMQQSQLTQAEVEELHVRAIRNPSPL